MICCTVCGEWVPGPGQDRLDICDGCWPNFAGAQPPLDIHAPMAREALEAYVFDIHQLTPLQAQALARMHVDWPWRQEGEGEP